MVESNLDSIKAQGQIVVCPNMSGQWRTTKLFLLIVSSLALLIATAFALLGLWLILPFAGLEIIALVSLMYWVAHQCRRKQVITFTDNRVLVEKGIDLPKYIELKNSYFKLKIVIQRWVIYKKNRL